MKIYKVSCYSECGSYSEPYLQSILIIADDEPSAIAHVRLTLVNEGENFIYTEDRWTCTELSDRLCPGMVLSVEHGSDC